MLSLAVFFCCSNRKLGMLIFFSTGYQGTIGAPGMGQAGPVPAAPHEQGTRGIRSTSALGNGHLPGARPRLGWAVGLLVGPAGQGHGLQHGGSCSSDGGQRAEA